MGRTYPTFPALRKYTHFAVREPQGGEQVITHVLRESVSPPSARTWTMWCGAQCIVLDDGIPMPPMDFYLEAQAQKADCAACKDSYETRPLVTRAKEPA